METKNGKLKMITIADKIGYGFRGVRKDGRVFIGVVRDVRPVNGRELVIIRQSDDKHKSFYMDEITRGWSASLCNGQPVLLDQ
jgi:hypothetical protein